MKRIACLATVTMIGVTLAAVSNEAQQARYRIRALELTGNLHVLTSDPAEEGRRTGGNTAVFVTSDGVVLVDTKYQGYGPDILAEVRQITDKPVTTIINTHTHYDHSGVEPRVLRQRQLRRAREHRRAPGQHRLRRRHGLRGRLDQELRAVPGREPQVPARHDLLDTAHAVRRRRPDRRLLLRPRPHRRRHVRRVQGRAHGPHRRHVRPQGIAVHRRRQLERQRHGVRRDAAGTRSTASRMWIPSSPATRTSHTSGRTLSTTPASTTTC